MSIPLGRMSIFLSFLLNPFGLAHNSRIRFLSSLILCLHGRLVFGVVTLDSCPDSFGGMKEHFSVAATCTMMYFGILWCIMYTVHMYDHWIWFVMSYIWVIFGFTRKQGPALPSRQASSPSRAKERMGRKSRSRATGCGKKKNPTKMQWNLQLHYRYTCQFADTQIL